MKRELPSTATLFFVIRYLAKVSAILTTETLSHGVLYFSLSVSVNQWFKKGLTIIMVYLC